MMGFVICFIEGFHQLNNKTLSCNITDLMVNVSTVLWLGRTTQKLAKVECVNVPGVQEKMSVYVYMLNYLHEYMNVNIFLGHPVDQLLLQNILEVDLDCFDNYACANLLFNVLYYKVILLCKKYIVGSIITDQFTNPKCWSNVEIP